MTPQRSIKPYAILSFIVVFVLFGLYWLLTHSFIEITSSQTIDAILTEQNSGKEIELSKITSEKRLVRKGSYEVSAVNQQGSYFSAVTTSGFLQTTTITIQPKAAHERTFVGTDPSPCMAYLESVLASYPCGSPMTQAKLHTRATQKDISYSLLKNDDSTASLVKTIKIGSTTIALAEEGLHGDEDGYAKTLYLLGNNLNPVRTRSLSSNLDKAKNYSIAPYKNGFVVYSTDFRDVQYFENFSANPTKLNISTPKNTELRAYALSTLGNALVISYTSLSIDDDLDSPANNTKSLFAILDNNQTKNVEIKGSYSRALLCGNKKLCLLENNTLSVFDIGGDKAKRLFKLQGISEIENSGNTLLAINNRGVVRVNPDVAEGYYSYLFNGYTYCGLSPDTTTSYVLCLINQQTKVALRVNTENPDKTNIDKKILEVAQNPDIKSISVYENFIHIVPDLGGVVYNSATNEFGFDPKRKQAANQSIAKSISDAKIDTSVYQVINLLK